MRAVHLERVGGAWAVRDADDPVLSRGAVIVKVLAARIPSYTARVLSGELDYDLPTPLVPGPTCVGVIDEVADDVFHLRPGQVALCNSLYSSGEPDGTADEILIGWTGSGTERSARMQRVYRHGSFAERARYPASCLTVLPGAEDWADVARLPFLASLAIADGGWRRGGLRGGRTVVVNGSTGNIGGAAVLLALARGAARVVATGRREPELERLAGLDRRVVPVRLSGNRSRDAEAIRCATGAGAEIVLDVLGDTPTPDPTLAGIDALRTRGTAVILGGVRHRLSLDYQQVQRRQLTITGSFMFGSATAAECWELVRSGAVDLTPVTAHTVDLDGFERGMSTAARLSGFDYAVLLPGG